jgi:PAS domain S-box-containing protein
MAGVSQVHSVANMVGRDEPSPLRIAAISLLAFAAFGLLAGASIELTRYGGRIATVWLPNAIAVAVLLRHRIPGEGLAIAAMALGNLCANLWVGDKLMPAALLALANAIEIALVVTVTRRLCRGQPDMEDIRDLGYFVLAAAVCGPVLSGAIATIALATGDSDWLRIFATWTTADALGLLIIAPSVMIAIDSWRSRRRPTRRELIEWSALTCCGTGLTLAVFAQTHYPLLFFIPPVVVAHAFRLGSLGTAFSTIKVAVIALTFTELGMGPINLVHYAHGIQLVVLEAFLASSILVGLPIASILATRERMTAQLAAQRAEMALLAENVTDAILRYDAHGICTYASPSTLAVLGLPPGDFVGQSPSVRAHPEAEDALRAVEERLVSGASTKERLTYRRYLDSVAGEPVFIEADCAAVVDPASGALEGIVVSARDVTARVTLERQLISARHHAENAARAKAQFLANMSHEIRTPMNGVLGFAELLRRMELEGDAGRYAELIERSGRSMMMLLNDILDISKIESGQLAVTEEPLSIAQVARDCVEIHTAQAERKAVSLTLTVGEDIPERMLSDPLRLRQILLNLIGNAVKFTEQGEIEVTVMREGDKLAIAVEDSGIGIDEDRLEHIFAPFVQAEGETTRRFGGTGLGLSISRQLATLLGGTLMVDSMPGVGSRFTLRIPVVEPATGEAPVGATPIPAHGPGVPPRGRVLLAEDHDINQMLITTMLEELGQDVTLARNGHEAIEAACGAHFAGHGFDLVLMDVQMPGCDGYAATRAIRAGGIAPRQLPIVALTANAFQEDVAAALAAGMQAHLAKPLVFEDLEAVLARWLPVRVVEDGAVRAPSPGATRRDAALDDRWRKRRSEAIAAVSEALREGGLAGVRIEDLARTVHKLAGTAGMFGEEELGTRAAALERALRSSVAHEVRVKLAQELLEAA